MNQPEKLTPPPAPEIRCEACNKLRTPKLKPGWEANFQKGAMPASFAVVLCYDYEEHPECASAVARIRIDQDRRHKAEELQRQRESRLEQWKQRPSFPRDLDRKTFQTFRVIPENERVVRLLQNWRMGDDFGFLLIGPAGCGKSHLALAFAQSIAHQILARNTMAPLPAYYPVVELLTEIKHTNFDLPDRVRGAAPVILDDLGTEHITEWSREIFYRVFDYRLSQRFPTLITTNLTMDELKERLHERIVSRIVGQCIPLTMQGKDHRTEEMMARFRMISARAGTKPNSPKPEVQK